MKKFFCGFFIIFLFLFVSSKNTLAQEFNFDYDVYYSVKNTGVTEVKTYVTITNKFTDYFAQNFILTLNSEQIEDAIASDEFGNLPVEITKKQGQTTIKISFVEKTVGINKQHKFLLVYKNHDIAIRKGRIWEIIIPGIEKSNEINTYNVHLSVPSEFGQAKYLSPKPKNTDIWTLNEIVNQGITAAYGDYQIFSFNLQYHLKNSSNKNSLQEIALPPDTTFQKIIINKISKNPQNVILDTDGNWLAKYLLKSNTEETIYVEGYAYIYISPRTDFKQKNIIFNDYLTTQKYWEITTDIKNKAEELKTAEDIYLFVKDYLKYDFDRAESGLKRLGAGEVFINPKTANCMEFTDLFVSLSRASGIPARVINGYAYTTNSRLQPFSLTNDILHAWPEYYDSNRNIWIPVDPTWGNTTNGVDYFHQFDFNHFAFAIMGMSSDYPYPAGAFKDDKPNKNVFIDLVSDDIKIQEVKPEIKFIKKTNWLPNFKINGKISIKNLSPVMIDLSNLKILGSSDLEVTNINNTGIPPYGFVEIPVKIKQPISLSTKIYNFTVSIANNSYQISTEINLWKPLNYSLVIIFIGIFVIIIGYVRFKKTKRTS